MKSTAHRIVLTILPLLCSATFAASTYYVSPRGDDGRDGRSEAKAWKTCAKVNATKFEAGDNILFQRGGEWREQLRASTDGVPGNPITYDAYGTGAKPRFSGSDVVPNESFSSAGGNKYSFKLAAKADTVLQDHVFIPFTLAQAGGVVTLDSDPRTNQKLYTACTRGNVILVSARKHIVIRNLIVDETAGQLNDGTIQGYGFRVEGSTDVVLEDCEAYRCGRHHFGVINSTEFAGRRLHAEYAQPDTPGGNTFYVSYSDENAPVPACTSEWRDLTADHMEDGKGGTCAFLISHGPRQGPILLSNVNTFSKISFMTAPITVKGGVIRGTGSIENFGAGALIDGVTIQDNAAIDQWGSDGTIQNCIAASSPTNNGPTGYSTVILFRDKARNNTVRFNTIIAKRFTCMAILAADANTKWYGNVMISDSNTIFSQHGPAGSVADFNFYSPSAIICGQALDSWKAQSNDKNSLSGDPKFRTTDFGLQPDSPCIKAAKVEKDRIPPSDFAGMPRPSGVAADIGAFAAAKK